MSSFRQIVAFAVGSCLLLHVTTANAEGRPNALPDLGCLAGKTWLLGDRLTIADFSVGGVIPNAQTFRLQSILKYPAGTRASAPCRAGTPN